MRVRVGLAVLRERDREETLNKLTSAVALCHVSSNPLTCSRVFIIQRASISYPNVRLIVESVSLAALHLSTANYRIQRNDRRVVLMIQ